MRSFKIKDTKTHYNISLKSVIDMNINSAGIKSVCIFRGVIFIFFIFILMPNQIVVKSTGDEV